MTAPRTRLRQTILKTLPQTVTVGDAEDDVETGIVWMLKPPKDLPKPCWMVQFGPEVDLTRSANAHEEGSIVTPEITDESHLYTAGDDFTNVEEWDIAEVLEVKATVGGSPNQVLVAGTDYEVVDTDADGALDAIAWLPGGDAPDTGTQVLVTYTHRMWETTRAHLLESRVMVHLVADKLADGEQGATEEHDPSEIIEGMQEALRAWFERDLRPALEDEEISLDLQLSIQTPLKLDGTSTVQAVASFDVQYESRVIIGQVRTARKVTANSTLQYEA